MRLRIAASLLLATILAGCAGTGAPSVGATPQHDAFRGVTYPFVTPSPTIVNVPTTCTDSGCSATIQGSKTHE